MRLEFFARGHRRAQSSVHSRPATLNVRRVHWRPTKELVSDCSPASRAQASATTDPDDLSDYPRCPASVAAGGVPKANRVGYPCVGGSRRLARSPLSVRYFKLLDGTLPPGIDCHDSAQPPAGAQREFCRPWVPDASRRTVPGFATCRALNACATSTRMIAGTCGARRATRARLHKPPEGRAQ